MTRTFGFAALVAYIGTIFAANYAIAHVGLVTVAPGLVAPAGVYFVGLALVSRDVVQLTLGRFAAVAAIFVGAGLSYFVAPSFALASGAAFLLSESADFAVFTPLQKRGWNTALAASTTVGAFIDSAVFLWLAFHSEALFDGQLVGKLTMTVAAVLVSAMIRPTLRRNLRVAA